MVKKYSENTSNFGISTYKEDSQLDRLEKKVDRILHILENGELSTSFEKGMLETSKRISKEIDDRYQNKLDSLDIGQLTDDELKRFKLGPYSKTSTPGSVSL